MSELGTCSVTPAGPYVAGDRVTFDVCYTVGPSGIARGGGIRIHPPSRGYARWDVGAVTARTTNDHATVSVTLENAHPLKFHHCYPPIVGVRVHGADLVEGDVIAVTFGEPGGFRMGHRQRARVQALSIGAASFRVFVDALGRGAQPPEKNMPPAWHEIENAPSVTVLPAAGAGFRVVIRAGAKVGERYRLSVAAEDAYDNPATDVEGPVVVLTDEGAPVTGVSLALQGGACAAPLERAPAAGRRLVAVDPARAIAGASNPSPEGFHDDANVYWGDLHVMNGDSLTGASGTTRSAYEYARDVMAHDFSAVTNSTGVNLDWDRDRRLADEFNAPGDFATLYACECGFVTGHKNVYWPEPPSRAFRGSSMEALSAFLEGQRAFAVPHHPNATSESRPVPPGWGVHDYALHDPTFDRVIEITQSRGSFETEALGNGVHLSCGQSSVQTALARGIRFGFVGGTDTHQGRPGNANCAPAWVGDPGAVTGGLTAVYAKELTREAIWQAIHDRRCYATNGARILLWTLVAGHPMGSEVSVSPDDAVARERTIRVRLLPTDNVERVDIVRNNRTIHSFSGSGLLEREFTDETALSDLYGQLPHGVAVYYYVRVLQQDRHLAWSSPVWFQPA